MAILWDLFVGLFGAWFMYGHLSDALTTGRARLRGTEDYTTEQPWRFSIALGLNLAFGLLLIGASISFGVIVSILPHWMLYLAGKIDWPVVVLAVPFFFIAAVRIVLAVRS